MSFNSKIEVIDSLIGHGADLYDINPNNGNSPLLEG